MHLTLSTLTRERIAHVLSNITPEDAAEIAACGLDAAAAFEAGYLTATVSGAVMRKGEAVAIWGCGPDPDGHGVPWMVATPEFRQHPRDVMDLSHQVIAKMQAAYPKLHNLVHARHDIAIRWLKRCGFEILTTPCGTDNEFFYFLRTGAHHV